MDTRFTNYGSIWLVQPLTDAAREWIDDNVATNDETQYWGDALVVEPRYVAALVEGMQAAGLSVG